MAKPTAKLASKWNRKLKAYEAEIQRLEESFFPYPEIPELTFWDGSSLWDDMEMFGYEITDHHLESLTGFWRDPATGNTHSEYWVPTSKEVEIDLLTVSIDQPPSYEVAWDARPINPNCIAVG